MAESPSIDHVARRFMAGIQHAEGDGVLTLTVGTEAANVIAVSVAGAHGRWPRPAMEPR